MASTDAPTANIIWLQRELSEVSSSQAARLDALHHDGWAGEGAGWSCWGRCGLQARGGWDSVIDHWSFCKEWQTYALWKWLSHGWVKFFQLQFQDYVQEYNEKYGLYSYLNGQIGKLSTWCGFNIFLHFIFLSVTPLHNNVPELFPPIGFWPLYVLLASTCICKSI